MYVCMYACMYVCMYACMYVCMYVYPTNQARQVINRIPLKQSFVVSKSSRAFLKRGRAVASRFYSIRIHRSKKATSECGNHTARRKVRIHEAEPGDRSRHIRKEIDWTR